MKVCICCMHRLGPDDVLETESRNMEAARTSIGLEGVRFRYYSCGRCGHDHVFLEVAPLPSETPPDREQRTAALARAAREVRVVRTTVLVVEQGV
jgi:hypothetical protein